MTATEQALTDLTVSLSRNLTQLAAAVVALEARLSFLESYVETHKHGQDSGFLTSRAYPPFPRP